VDRAGDASGEEEGITTFNYLGVNLFSREALWSARGEATALGGWWNGD
jgi:hypothetical protein